MQSGAILKFYSNKAIQKEIMKLASNREVCGRRADGSYMKRPDTLQYPNDIKQRVKDGVASFHCSVERWSNPMGVSTDLSKKEIDDLRIGWDWIIDIDSHGKLEYSQIAAAEVCNFLKDNGITPSLKFSGRRGFHIAVATNAFPKKVDFKELSSQYPEFPQTLSKFLKDKIKDKILEKLVDSEGGVAALMNENPDVKELNPFQFVDIEENWGSRHLFRMPYSLHEKSWLVSVPIKLFKLKSFKMEQAKPESIKTTLPFLQNKDLEAQDLILQSLDWSAKLKPRKIKKPRGKYKLKKPIPEEFFPPCIKFILKGITEGRKRSIFTLVTFLRTVNWEFDKIEERMIKWNQDNPRPLSKRAITTQVKWHERQRRNLMPPNCDSDLFFKSIGACKKDKICEKIKNPVNYAVRAYRSNFKRKRKA